MSRTPDSNIEHHHIIPREYSASPEQVRIQQQKEIIYKNKSKGFIRRHPVLTALGIGALLLYFGMGAARNFHDVRSSRAFKGILDATGAGRIFGRPDEFRAKTLGPGTGPTGPARPGLPGRRPSADPSDGLPM